MGKKAGLARTRRQPKKGNQSEAGRRRIAAAIAELDQIRPNSVKAAQAISLFKTWLADESGYDEKAWPRLKKALEGERQRTGAARLFND